MMNFLFSINIYFEILLAILRIFYLNMVLHETIYFNAQTLISWDEISKEISKVVNKFLLLDEFLLSIIVIDIICNLAYLSNC